MTIALLQLYYKHKTRPDGQFRENVIVDMELPPLPAPGAELPECIRERILQTVRQQICGKRPCNASECTLVGVTWNPWVNKRIAELSVALTLTPFKERRRECIEGLVREGAAPPDLQKALDHVSRGKLLTHIMGGLRALWGTPPFALTADMP